MTRTTTTTSPRSARALRAGGVLAVIALVALVLTSTRAPDGPARTDGAVAPATARTSSSPSMSGREVYLRDCAWCHGQQAQGTSVAPRLSDKGPAALDFYLRTGRMPLSSPDETVRRHKPAYDAATIGRIVGFVDSLGSGGEPIPEVRPGDVAEGQSLFISNCAACHSSSGTGVVLTDGTIVPSLFADDPREVAEAMRLGPGPMPPFTRGQLSDDQLDDVVSYVSMLGNRQIRGGGGLDQYGPILEGSFAWAVPVPILIIVLLLGRRRKQ